MKKTYTILSMMLGSAMMLTAAPAPDQSEAERVSAAQDIVSIKPNEDKSGLSLSIAGFELGLSNPGGTDLAQAARKTGYSDED